MTSRSVVLIDPHDYISQQIQKLVIENINFFCVESTVDAKNLLSRQACSVGLVILDPSLQDSLEEVESLVAATSKTEWIALVSPAFMEMADVRSFVANAFYDYHTLPVDLQRLLMTIGHACGIAHLRLSLTKNQK